jgi:hypothetical protein
LFVWFFGGGVCEQIHQNFVVVLTGTEFVILYVHILDADLLRGGTFVFIRWKTWEII